MSPLLLRNVRIVPVRTPAPREPVSLRVVGGTVVAVGTHLSPEPGDRVLDADGRWVIPGLWDQHVHLTQWSQIRARLDVSGTRDPSEVTGLVRAHQLTLGHQGWIFGYGFRLTDWTREPSVAELDAISGDRPVVLTSGDAHAGWLNSAALAALGATADGVLTEAPWFTLMTRVVELTSAQDGNAAVADAVADATAHGVVGIVDFEFAEPQGNWRQRVTEGVNQLWVRSAAYPEYLEDVIAAGLSTGSALTDDGLVTMGPLKIISDGSMNSRTAFCHDPYPSGTGRGIQNHDRAELIELLTRARAAGLQSAIHAIGDAAVHEALEAFGATGATGTIEHAQLLADQDIAALAALGVRASVQPAHLLDDRDAAEHLWSDRAHHCFRLRSMLDAGVTVAFGSDAPVSPLNPWAAMAAAVHRSADERDPWNPAEAITAAEALGASIDGQDTIGPASRADLALLDRNPLAATSDSASAADHLRAVRVDATIRSGHITHTSAGFPA